MTPSQVFVMIGIFTIGVGYGCLRPETPKRTHVILAAILFVVIGIGIITAGLQL